ncbi:MAG: tRNA lysidine(34) synthetase TilS [Myxococcota bacterium]
MLGRVEEALVDFGARDCSLLIAVSGGLDSTVLAHALARLRVPLDLQLAIGHVNHGLRGAESDGDEKAVAELASRLDARFAVERVDPSRLRQGGSSRTRPTTQEAARSLRRAALERIRTRLGCERIATAHHGDDQVETVLMRILRGCGPDSLGGIAEMSPDGVAIRPLLCVSRDEILAYAKSNRLTWREDPSNADPKYTRSRLRARVIPGLRDFNPRLLRAIGDLAEAHRRESEWLESLVEEQAERLFDRSRPGCLGIAAEGWRERPEALARRLVVLAMVEMGSGRDMSRAHLMRILEFLRQGRPGTAIELPGDLELRRISPDCFRLQPVSEGEEAF